MIQSYATSRVAALEGPYGCFRLLAYDVRNVEAVRPYSPDRSTSLSQPRNPAPAKVNGASKPILAKPREPKPIPQRKGMYTLVREDRLSGQDARAVNYRAIVVVRCDCGREVTMQRSHWCEPSGPKSCKECSYVRRWGRKA